MQSFWKAARKVKLLMIAAFGQFRRREASKFLFYFDIPSMYGLLEVSEWFLAASFLVIMPSLSTWAYYILIIWLAYYELGRNAAAPAILITAFII